MLKRVLTSATVLMSLSLAGCQSMTELERELSASLDLEVRILAQDHDRCAGGQLVRWLEEYRRLMPIDQVRVRFGGSLFVSRGQSFPCRSRRIKLFVPARFAPARMQGWALQVSPEGTQDAQSRKPRVGPRSDRD